jgi:hypothetical protein
LQHHHTSLHPTFITELYPPLSIYHWFIIKVCCLLNYSFYNYVVFWTIPHITMLSFELFLIQLCCLLNNYFSYNYVVFWTTISHITMLSFELFLI